MPTLTVPLIGEHIVEVRLVAFLKEPGDAVVEGEPLYEVETEKTSVEVGSTASGTVGRWLVAVGDEIEVGTPVCEITDAEVDAQVMGDADATVVGAGDVRPGFADESLSARQIELNAALRRGAETAVVTLSVAVPEAVVAKVVAAVSAECPGSGLVTPFQALARLAARTAARHPRLRAKRLGHDRLRVYDTVSIGIAVASDDGDLRVLAMHDADRMSAREFGDRYVAGIEHVRTGKSTVDGRVTLLLSHLEIDWCAPVVVPPSVATLFVGAPHPGPSGPQRQIVLTFDHCVLNGQQGTAYLSDLRSDLNAVAGTATASDRPALVLTPAPAPASGPLQDLAERVVGVRLDPRRPIGEQGVGSAAAVALVIAINERFGSDLPATAVWRYPTLDRLSQALTANGVTWGTEPATTVRHRAGRHVRHRTGRRLVRDRTGRYVRHRAGRRVRRRTGCGDRGDGLPGRGGG